MSYTDIDVVNSAEDPNCADKGRMTLFVCSPDSYADVLNIYLKCFKRYRNDFDYDFVLATNRNRYDGFTVFNNENEGDSWTQRALPVLKQIGTKYVLVMCDDLFICEALDRRKIGKILDTMDEQNINFCKLKPMKKGIPVEGNPDLIRLHKRTPYALSLYMGIYNREFLIKELGDGSRSAWEIERDWMTKTLDAPDEYYDDVAACNKEIIKVIHGVTKGKWTPKAVKQLKRAGFEIESDREIMSKGEVLAFELKQAVGECLSPINRYRVKRILKKLGFTFSTDN